MRSAIALALAAIAASAAPARAGNGVALVRYVPDTASEILVVDMAHARTSAALDHLILQMRAHSPRWDAVAEDGVGLGLAIDTLLVAVTRDPSGGAPHAIAIVDGMAGPILAHLKTPASHATEHAGIAIWTIDGPEDVAIIDRHLVITTAGDMAATIDRAHRASRPPPPSNLDTLRDMLEAGASSGADVSGGRILTADFRAWAALHLTAEPVWIAFSIAASVRASLAIRIAFGDDAGATAAGAAMRRLFVGPDAELRPMMLTIGPELVDSLALDVDRAQIHLSASMPTDEVDRLVEDMRPLL